MAFARMRERASKFWNRHHFSRILCHSTSKNQRKTTLALLQHCIINSPLLFFTYSQHFEPPSHYCLPIPFSYEFRRHEHVTKANKHPHSSVRFSLVPNKSRSDNFDGRQSRWNRNPRSSLWILKALKSKQYDWTDHKSAAFYAKEKFQRHCTQDKRSSRLRSLSKE